jgi:hypothetical protein
MNQIRVFLNGTMVVFRDGNNNFLKSHPTKRITIEALGTVGFTFLDADSDKTMYQVQNFANVLDEAGAPLGATFEDTFAAINSFIG